MEGSWMQEEGSLCGAKGLPASISKLPTLNI
ncbi:hypothetical protein J3D55_002020 [Chryseobacterium ginsenosidimutans]|nr:hypothetical protein [Chryseobacterium ginsenosidimutans]